MILPREYFLSGLSPRIPTRARDPENFQIIPYSAYAAHMSPSSPYGDGWLARITADDASEETIPAAEYARLVSA